VLKYLLEKGQGTVTEVAEANGLSVCLTSQYLRTLNARGILLAERDRSWVRYRVGANPTIAETAPLITALKHDLLSRRDAVDAAFRDLTAFTHSRRIAIVRCLRGTAGLTFSALTGRTGISRDALRRHLRKLISRGIVTVQDDVYTCCRPSSRLARALVAIAVTPPPG